MDKIPVLCTRTLDEHLIAEANDSNIVIDVLPFIRTEPLETVETQQEIDHVLLLEATVVFTSKQAVQAVADLNYSGMPQWNIYCTGNATADAVKTFFAESLIAGTADSATSLAELIIGDGEAEEVVFFCGDIRRDELPQLLIDNGIGVNEIIVYQTIEVPHRIHKEYKAVLFFSPSAVKSFFSVNKISSEVLLFAIGSTTAESIKYYTDNRVIVAERATGENLLEKLMEYFT
jgi:uroporphyrinogen-III synthase